MSEPKSLPDPAAVGGRAVELLDRLKADPAWPRLDESSKKYVDCWGTFTGYPVIEKWNLDADKGALFSEAMRAMCLKAAVFELTGGDEAAAELLLPLPVDEMTHAVLAQHNLITEIQIRNAVLLPHMTDLEEFGYEPGDYTHQCYVAAGWGEPPVRYWIGTAEAKRRLRMLEAEYNQIGIRRYGREHDKTFTVPDPRDANLAAAAL